MQPHTIADNTILSACKEIIVKSMLGVSAKKHIYLVPFPLSSDIQNFFNKILYNGG